MKLVCPACGATHSLEMIANDASAREVVTLAFGVPASLRGLLVRYLALHRPKKSVLSWGKAATLLRELVAGIEAGSFSRNGQTYAAPVAYWERALEKVLASAASGKIQRPLKGHGYLLEVMVGESDKGAARDEVARDTRARNRPQRASKDDARKGMQSARDALGDFAK